MEQNKIPMGLGMALSQNPKAMQKFAMLSETKKQEIISKTHSIQSKEEMNQYVNNILYET